MNLTAKPAALLALAIIGTWCLMKATDMPFPVGTDALWGIAAFCIAAFTLGLKRLQNGHPLSELAARSGEVLLLMGAGYSNDWVVKIAGIPVGWVAAAAALLTEFVRGMGGPHVGPLPATRRMPLLAVASALCILEPLLRQDGKIEAVMQGALGLIILGSAATLATRTKRNLEDFPNKSAGES